MTIHEFRETLPDTVRFDGQAVHDLYYDYVRDTVTVGDGMTVCLWSDRHACTVVARSRNKLVLQQDKATLSEDFKPDFIIGGFAAHCTNQDEQEYTYAPDPHGRIYTAYWSPKRHRFYADKVLTVIVGRHEFYDYNF